MKLIKEITAERENYRTVPLYPGSTQHFTTKRDPIEPLPVGSIIAMVFRVTGYDPDCDGSLMARLEAIDRHGESTGWAPTHLGLYPDTDIQLDSPDELFLLAEKVQS